MILGSVPSSTRGGVPRLRANPVLSQTSRDRLSQVASLLHLAPKLHVAPQQSALGTRSAIWDLLDEVPAEERVDLIPMLKPEGVRRLWSVGAGGYKRMEDDGVTWGAAHSYWQDWPEEPGEVVYFEGLAALPKFNILGINRFQKAFFVDDEYNAYGRVIVPGGPLGKLLYPGYFKTHMEVSSIPATGEFADVSLEYLPPDELNLNEECIPEPNWPAPGRHIFPFHGGLVDYLRPVGPGVYAGVGWKAPRPEMNDLGRKFLPFVLIRVYK